MSDRLQQPNTHVQPRNVNEVEPQCPMPFSATRDDLAPLFTASGFLQEIKKFNLLDYRGKWVILFFYPSDFTPV